jgi:hypothetical protein
VFCVALSVCCVVALASSIACLSGRVVNRPAQASAPRPEHSLFCWLNKVYHDANAAPAAIIAAASQIVLLAVLNPSEVINSVESSGVA